MIPLTGLAVDNATVRADVSRRNQVTVDGAGKARQGWHICSLTILKATKLRSGAVYSPMPLLRSLGFWRAGFYKDVAPLALVKVGRVSPLRADVVKQDASVPAGSSQRNARPTTCAKRLERAWLQTACGRRVEFNAKAPRRQGAKREQKTRPGGWPLRPTADCGHSSDTFWFNFFASSRLCAFALKAC